MSAGRVLLILLAMRMVEDFTAAPRGMLIALGGRVDLCPLCGRNGIEEHPECGSPYFLHVQTSDVLGDGMRVEPLDCCAIPTN